MGNSPPRILFITGKLAEYSLRQILDTLSRKVGFEYEVQVLGITVAALMTTNWISRKLASTTTPYVNGKPDRVILPGAVSGDLDPLVTHFGVPVERGPRDLFDLPEYFGQEPNAPPDLSGQAIEILAEINHAPRHSLGEILSVADRYRAAGADLIDVGCLPGKTWIGCAQTIRALKREGHRLSIDSFNPIEVEAAVSEGAELVLSANSTNAEWAATLAAEFVLIPDQPQDLSSLKATRNIFHIQGKPLRLDPILEPIGFGFGESLNRYRQIRRQFPDDKMLMGIGNLTEMTEVDSSGVNFLLAALCSEWRIESVLATEVINWGRSAVREFEIARRLVHHAVQQRRVPKHLGGELVMLRDPKLKEQGEAGLARLRQFVTDPNFRIFAERGEIHLFNRDGYWHGGDPYEVFDRMIESVGTLTPEHTFYLGYELCKAKTALTLGKHYQQDQSLRWGFLTEPEVSAVERRKAERQLRRQEARKTDTQESEPSGGSE